MAIVRVEFTQPTGTEDIVLAFSGRPSKPFGGETAMQVTDMARRIVGGQRIGPFTLEFDTTHVVTAESGCECVVISTVSAR